METLTWLRAGVDAIYGQLPRGERGLEVWKSILEEVNEVGLGRGVELPLQPRGEHLRLQPAVNQTLNMINQ